MGKINVKTKIYGLVIIVAIFATSNIYAQRNQRYLEDNNLRPLQSIRQGRMIDQNPDLLGRGMLALNLTEDQVAKMKDLRTKNLKQMQPISNLMQEKRARMRTLTTAENINQNEIDKLIDEITGLSAKQMKLRVAHQQELRALLTEDQRVIFDSFSGGFGQRQFARGNARIGRGAMHSRLGIRSR